ncbi:MAG: phosphatidylserine decarboxylase family protein [Flavobacteriales bacterium]
MRFHREGKKVIPISIGILLGVNILFPLLTTYERYAYLTLVLLSLIFLILILQFFRIPERHTPLSDTDIIAPADGSIVAHEEVEETEYFHDRRLKLSIFMSPLVPHINWCPVEGKVRFFRYHPGRYLIAWHPKASAENECTTVVLERNDGTPILCRQIAGAIARRISWYCEEEKQMQQGEELGFIKFGSRIDVFLPQSATVHVGMNDAVTGAETILASV